MIDGSVPDAFGAAGRFLQSWSASTAQAGDDSGLPFGTSMHTIARVGRSARAEPVVVCTAQGEVVHVAAMILDEPVQRVRRLLPLTGGVSDAARVDPASALRYA